MMKNISSKVLAVVIAVVAGSVFAEWNEVEVSPLGLGFGPVNADGGSGLIFPHEGCDVYGVDLCLLAKHREVLGAQVGVLGGVSGTLYGLGVSGLVAHSQDMYGITVAGIGTQLSRVTGLAVGGFLCTNSCVVGVTCAGAVTLTDECYGLGIAGLGVRAGREFVGLQIAGLMTYADYAKGLQLSSLYNVAKDGSVIQIGCCNSAGDATCLQIGLVNWGSTGLVEFCPIIRAHF